MQKGGVRREKWERFPEKSPEVWGSTGRSEEKLKLGLKRVTCHRKKTPEIGFKIGRMVKKIDGRTGKNVGEPSNNRPKTDLKRGKAGKTEILERKRWGGGGAKKWALMLILQRYEIAKWVQMNFSRIFFRRSLAGNAEMLYLCTRNREATLLQERVTL